MLFKAEMVRAILEGRKTQTRRIIKDATGLFWDHKAWRPEVVNGEITHWVSMDTMNDGHLFGAGSPQRKCPQGRPGDRLWVRETWNKEGANFHDDFTKPNPPYYYAADYDAEANKLYTWKPSLFMPRAASRITLEITDVRAQRLNDISDEDALAEGVERNTVDIEMVRHCLVNGSMHCDRYARLWDSINGEGAWKANPYVWAITFKRLAP